VVAVTGSLPMKADEERIREGGPARRILSNQFLSAKFIETGNGSIYRLVHIVVSFDVLRVSGPSRTFPRQRQACWKPGPVGGVFRVLTAANGAEALAVCAAPMLQAFCSTSMMPDMDGFEVCRRLKSNPSTIFIPGRDRHSTDRPADRRSRARGGAD